MKAKNLRLGNLVKINPPNSKLGEDYYEIVNIAHTRYSGDVLLGFRPEVTDRILKLAPDEDIPSKRGTRSKA